MREFVFTGCSSDIINELKYKNAIEGFKMGIPIDGEGIFCIQDSKTRELVAILEMNNADGWMINEFEVLKRYRNQGVGSEIVNYIKSFDDVDNLKLYAENEQAKHFWEKCEFSEYDDGTGTPIMYWDKNKY